MRRLLPLTFAITLVGFWMIPSSADAGILQRLFGRNRVRAVPTTPMDTGTYRRYSYEPGMQESTPSYQRRSTTKRTQPAWMYPKSDPRRYR